MPKEFIVAIELGSSKMTGIAGKKSLDGSIQVLACVKEDSSLFIRKGVVYNVDKTAQCLTSIITKLEKQLKTTITQVYVGVGGQSIRSIRNVIAKDLPGETLVTQDMVVELMDNNRSVAYPDQEILDAAVQEYKVDSQYQIDPVGIQCSRIEGNFLNILQRKAFYKNLNKCFETADINIAELYLAPLALADSVLTETEKRSGCALVDMGADTTTVSVYYKNILRHLAVIPLGGNNITKDIASLQMEEADAERMKLKYGSAYTENSEIDNNMKLSIDQDRQVESRKFIEIVEGRLEEIVANVWCQVPDEYCDKLLGGIILTGGASNMKNIEQAFRNYTHVDKIRVAKFVTQTITSSISDINAHDGKMNTVLGLLAKGDINCAGQDSSVVPVPLWRPPRVSSAPLRRSAKLRKRLAVAVRRQRPKPARRQKPKPVRRSSAARRTASGTRPSRDLKSLERRWLKTTSNSSSKHRNIDISEYRNLEISTSRK